MKSSIRILPALLLLAGCAYKVQKQPEPVSPALGSLLGFSQIQTSVLGPKCTRCHQWAGSHPAVQARVSEIKARITSTDPGFRMPPPGAEPLTPQEQAALVAWLDRGAPLNPGDTAPAQPPVEPPPAPVPPALTFASVKANVIDGKCLRCHKTDLDTYEHVKPLLREIDFRVKAIGEDEQMPPANKPQLTEDEKKLLLDWIAAGAPET